MKNRSIKAYAAIDKYGDLLTGTIRRFRADTEDLIAHVELKDVYDLKVIPVTILLPSKKSPRKKK